MSFYWRSLDDPFSLDLHEDIGPRSEERNVVSIDKLVFLAWSPLGSPRDFFFLGFPLVSHRVVAASSMHIHFWAPVSSSE